MVGKKQEKLQTSVIFLPRAQAFKLPVKRLSTHLDPG